MEIRFLQQKDTLPYKELRLFSLEESPYSFSDSYEDLKSNSLTDFENEIIKIDNPLESFTLGAFTDENQLIGFVKFKRDARSKARHKASLYSLYVKPNHRKNGIGRKLIEELLHSIEHLTELKQLQLSTIITKDSLIGFYRSFGFKKMGGIIRKDLIIENQYVDAIYMVKYMNQQNENRMNINYKISNTEFTDLEFIYQLFEKAISYIKTKKCIGWTTYDKNFIISDLKNKNQFKVTVNDDIIAVYSVCYSDSLIWREREKGDAIYLHRIVVNPLFKGQKQFKKILDWSIDSAIKNQLKYIRMDTWAENPNIIEYYKTFGFIHIEDYTTPDTLELPEQHRSLKVALLEYEL